MPTSFYMSDQQPLHYLDRVRQKDHTLPTYLLQAMESNPADFQKKNNLWFLWLFKINLKLELALK